MTPVFTIWKKELKDNLRDRRTLFTVILMPVLLMPAILIGTFKLQESQAKKSVEKVAFVSVTPADASPTLVAFLKTQEKIEVKPTVADAAKAIESGEVNVVLTLPADTETKLAAGEPVTVDGSYKSSNIDSQTALAKVTAALQAFNGVQAAKRLAAANLPPSVLTSVIPRPTDLATPEERGGFFVGLLLPMFIVVFAIVGGMYIAIDVSAGEKERKTLEALLFTPVPRFGIVLGKFLAVATAGTATIILSLASLYASFKYFPPDFGQGEVTIAITPATLGLMLAIGVVLSIMFSGLLLSVGIFAKSFKEAQNYITPLYLLAVLPTAIAAQLPGLKPTPAFFLVPGMNAVFVMKEALLGQTVASHILLTFASLLVFATAGIVIATKIYSREGVLFRE